MQTISGNHPGLTEQISWLRDRAADAEQFRELLVNSGHVNAEKAAIDADMWAAVLNSFEAFAAGFLV
jgi:hypothetical protein